MRRPEKWRGPESNRRHHGFQPCALPTELPRPRAECSRRRYWLWRCRHMVAIGGEGGGSRENHWFTRAEKRERDLAISLHPSVRAGATAPRTFASANLNGPR